MFGILSCFSSLILLVQKAAIKKMDMQASKEFLAELRVLTHVHHLNLVRLIGYCVEGSLFLIYKYVENGNLSQHLHDSEPLWSYLNGGYDLLDCRFWNVGSRSRLVGTFGYMPPE
ncbi:hypothetical protein SSX86_006670 [Deinandra increscens subsp. villosa]|uniref:Protein kinase domain-containing protein n=1 Tax=Deinandra increscens subsp. villosa TaxID=3103831 RepID=A0AAP0DJC0_9ASTR